MERSQIHRHTQLIWCSHFKCFFSILIWFCLVLFFCIIAVFFSTQKRNHSTYLSPVSVKNKMDQSAVYPLKITKNCHPSVVLLFLLDSVQVCLYRFIWFTECAVEQVERYSQEMPFHWGCLDYIQLNSFPKQMFINYSETEWLLKWIQKKTLFEWKNWWHSMDYIHSHWHSLYDPCFEKNSQVITNCPNLKSVLG